MQKVHKPLGKFSRQTNCRFCKSLNTVKFLDFGEVPLAGAFLTEQQLSEEKFYPFEVRFCQDCTLVQVGNTVAGDVLFGNYYYFSSAIGTLVDHFIDFAQEMTDRLLQPGKSFAVEIGSNDGILLRPLVAAGVKCLGVDPASNVVSSIDDPNIKTVNEFFTERVALSIREQHGKADAVLSSYSFAHIEDMIDVMKGVKALLKDDGVLVFEVYYLGTLLEEMQYDLIYHEHVYYYSLTALQSFLARFGMEMFDVKRIPGVRAGAMRFYARTIGQRREPISEAVQELLVYERDHGFNTIELYLNFAQEVEKTKVNLLNLLGKLKTEGKTVIGYGASGRATTITGYCGIDTRYLDYVVDDAPAKIGLYTPGNHLAIKAWSATEALPHPDYALVFAWSFIDEVKKKRLEYLRQGGKFIVPLPEVKVINE